MGLTIVLHEFMKRGFYMFSAIFAFVAANILYFALHLETSAFPKPLTKAEERQAFLALKEGDKTAHDKLIEHNLRLVAHVVKKYYSSSTEQEDLISIGTIGLIKAVNSFDCEKGARFSTYAARCIENEVLMHFRSSKKDKNLVYIHDALDNDENKNSLTLNDVMADTFDLAASCESKEDVKKLYKEIENLKDREREIVILRYGLCGKKPLTQREVAQKLDISRSYVSRIEKKTLDDIKKKF